MAQWRGSRRFQLKWTSGVESLHCPICDATTRQDRVASARVPWQRNRVTVTRCQRCNAIVLSAALPPTVTYDDTYVDRYIEQTAGIEAIAGTLAKVTRGPGARMLDIGCGYGFGLDLGERLHGWRGVGVDASPAAQRGRSELGIDIREARFDESFAVGERFDVVLASELIEHLDDPRTFVRVAAEHLSDDGVLLITTPDASVVHADSPATTVLSALAIGDHVFLVDADGLHRLLSEAGLDAIVRASGPSLIGAAWRTPDGRAHVDEHGAIDLAKLADYCSARLNDAPDGSALRLGMAMRAVKFRAYSGDFVATADALPPLRAALLARNGLDLDAAGALAAVPQPPPILGPAAYFSGIVAAYVSHDLERADALFAASAAAGRRHFEEYGTYKDPEMARFEAQSLGERVILAARRGDADGVRQAMSGFEAGARRADLDPAAVEEIRRRAAELLPTV